MVHGIFAADNRRHPGPSELPLLLALRHAAPALAVGRTALAGWKDCVAYLGLVNLVQTWSVSLSAGPILLSSIVGLHGELVCQGALALPRRRWFSSQRIERGRCLRYWSFPRSF